MLFTHQTHFVFFNKDLPTKDELYDILFTNLPEIKVVWDENFCTFILDEYKRLIHAHKSTHGILGIGEEFKIQVEGYNIDQFHKLIQDATELIITTDAKLNSSEVRKTKYVNYPEMITQLEKSGIVSTCETESIMATDLRKFTWNGESYDVDCLGTKHCINLTNDIEEEWKKLDLKM